MKILFTICSVTILLILGCESNTSTNLSLKQPNNSNFISPDSIYTILANKPEHIDWDSLPILHPKTWVTKAISTTSKPLVREKIINYDISTFQLDSTNQITYARKKIQTRKLKVPREGYVIAHGDTIYAPKKVVLGKPKELKVKMAFQPNAKKDIQYMNIEQGLPSSMVFNGLIDQHGYLWFATLGSGIVQFDGDLLKNFTENSGLSSNFVSFLYQDRKNNIWMGTMEGGLMKYDGVHIWNYSSEQGFPDSFESAAEDDEGNLWFGSDFGFVKFRDNGDDFSFDELTLYQDALGIKKKIVKAILPTTNGDIWFGTNEGLYSLSSTHLKQYNFGLNKITSIIEDSKGTVWIGSRENGFAAHRNGQIQRFFCSKNETNNMILSLLEDKDGNLNVGTKSEGLLIFDGKRFSAINEDMGLTSNSISNITIDLVGNKWLSTWGGGICRLGNSHFTQIPKETGGIETTINRIKEGPENTMWLGGSESQLFLLKGANYQEFKLDNNRTNNKITSITHDESQNTWFSSLRSSIISRFNGSSFKHYELFEEEKRGYVNHSIVDLEGILWFAPYLEGIVRYDGERFNHLSIFNGSTDDAAYQIIEDSKGNIFFLNYKSIYVLQGNSLQKFETEPRFITSAFLDNKDNIWIGTDKGPVHLIFDTTKNKLQYHSYHANTDTVGSMIHSIHQSKNENIWAATASKGIYIFTQIDSIDQPGCYGLESINKADGFKGSGVNIGAGLIDSKNKLWLGTQKGLSNLNIENYTYVNSIPKLYLTGVEVNDKLVDSESLQNYKSAFEMGLSKKTALAEKKIKPYFNIPENLELRHNFNHLSFSFDAIEWKAPHAIKFQYKLDKLDKKWSTVQRGNSADYRNIPFGNYTFKLRAVGKSGVWSEVTEYSFTILPPWWYTWWAKIGYLLIGVGILWLLIQLRVSRIRKKTEKLYELKLLKQINLEEGKHLEKARLAKELHDGLLGSLFGIRLALDRLNQHKEDPHKKERERYINKISDLEKEVRSLSHGLSPHLAIADLAFTHIIQSLLEELNDTHQLKYSLVNDPSISWEKINAKIKFNLYRVVQESLQNVVKHSKASFLNIYFTKIEDHIELLISDNGIGFQNEKSTHGIGLKNITSRIKRLNGSVIFDNKQGQGLNIIISIPLK